MIYAHFKGGRCDLLYVARNSEEPHEEFAVYQEIGSNQIWIRLLAMFNEHVVWPDGVIRPRFVEATSLDPSLTLGKRLE